MMHLTQKGALEVAFYACSCTSAAPKCFNASEKVTFFQY